MAGGFADILRSLLLSVEVHLSPGCIYGLRAGAEPGAPGAPALPPGPGPRWDHPLLPGSLEASAGGLPPTTGPAGRGCRWAPSAHLRALTAGEGGEVDHPHPENSVGACQRGCGQLGAKAGGGCTKLPSLPLTGAMLVPLPWALSWASSSKAVWKQGWGPGKGE